MITITCDECNRTEIFGNKNWEVHNQRPVGWIDDGKHFCSVNCFDHNSERTKARDLVVCVKDILARVKTDRTQYFTDLELSAFKVFVD